MNQKYQQPRENLPFSMDYVQKFALVTWSLVGSPNISQIQLSSEERKELQEELERLQQRDCDPKQHGPGAADRRSKDLAFQNSPARIYYHPGTEPPTTTPSMSYKGSDGATVRKSSF